jgi:hypothetical protein
VFLGIGQLLVGPPQKPLPDLTVVAVTALLPMVVAVRIEKMPGAASGVCGVYLLPASTIALLQPTLAPPPLLLVPAIAFDLALWLQPEHVAAVVPWLRHTSRPQPAQGLNTRRAIFAGAAFGVVLTVVEVPFRLFLGGDPTAWSGAGVWLAAISSAIVCGGLATLVNDRGTAA